MSFFDKLFPVDPEELDIEGGMREKASYIPERLFRYRGPERVDNLKNGVDVMIPPDKFNDPFDSEVNIDEFRLFEETIRKDVWGALEHSGIKDQFSREEVDRIKRSSSPFREVSALILEKVGPVAGKDNEEVIKILQSALQDQLGPIHERLFNDAKKGLRILCLSEVLSSVVMWSHYAQNHEGFCVEYNFSTFGWQDPKSRTLYPVTYSDSLLDITSYMKESIRGDFNNLFIARASLHKAKEWSYEREWRMVFPLGDVENDKGRGFEVEMPKPIAIYAGVFAEESLVSDLISFGEYQKIPVYRMQLDRSELKVVQGERLTEE